MIYTRMPISEYVVHGIAVVSNFCLCYFQLWAAWLDAKTPPTPATVRTTTQPCM